PPWSRSAGRRAAPSPSRMATRVIPALWLGRERLRRRQTARTNPVRVSRAPDSSERTQKPRERTQETVKTKPGKAVRGMRRRIRVLPLDREIGVRAARGDRMLSAQKRTLPAATEMRHGPVRRKLPILLIGRSTAESGRGSRELAQQI